MPEIVLRRTLSRLAALSWATNAPAPPNTAVLPEIVVSTMFSFPPSYLDPPMIMIPPPFADVAWLPDKTEFVISIGAYLPPLATPAPPSALLPETVVWDIASGPTTNMPPP